jgi:hypothetical protein
MTMTLTDTSATSRMTKAQPHVAPWLAYSRWRARDSRCDPFSDFTDDSETGIHEQMVITHRDGLPAYARKGVAFDPECCHPTKEKARRPCHVC